MQTRVDSESDRLRPAMGSKKGAPTEEIPRNGTRKKGAPTEEIERLQEERKKILAEAAGKLGLAYMPRGVLSSKEDFEMFRAAADK